MSGKSLIATNHILHCLRTLVASSMTHVQLYMHVSGSEGTAMEKEKKEQDRIERERKRERINMMHRTVHVHISVPAA